MSNHSMGKYISVAGISLLVAGGAAYTSAQNSPDDDLIEEVHVEGFRQSLRNAIDSKRSSEGVTDSIFAEDIGKSSDQNIADALQRVTGVSIQREDGEGTSITVRGAGPDLNNIKLNGITLTSSSENQTVDLSAFSADILSNVEVIKTASADHDEGSLGATVRLNTFKPLNVAKDRRALEVQQRYNDLSDERDRKFSGAYSQKFLNNTLGIAGTLFHETQTVRRDQYSVNKFHTQKVARARDSITGEVLTQLPNPVTGVMEDGVQGLARDQSGYQSFFNTRERKGFTTTVQFTPTPVTDIQFDITYSDQFVETDDNAIRTFPKNNSNLATDPIEDWYTFDQATRTFTKAQAREGRGRTSRLQSGVRTENRIYSFSVTHELDDITLSFRGGLADTMADDDYFTFVNTNNFGNINKTILDAVPADLIQPVGYDCTSGRCMLVTGTHFVDFGADPDAISDNTALTANNPDDLDAIHLQQAQTRDRRMNDEAKSFYADVDWQVDFAGVHEVEFGFKYEERSKHVVNQFVNYEGNGSNEIGPDDEPFKQGLATIALSQVTDGNIIPGDFLSGLGYIRNTHTDGWATVNAREAFRFIFENQEIRFVPNKKADRAIDLENAAAYVKFNFSYFGEKVYGNVGLRYVETDIESSGFSGIKYFNGQPLLDTSVYYPVVHDTTSGVYNPAAINFGSAERLAAFQDFSSIPNPEDFLATGEHSYNMVLPSFNINWLMANDLIGRLGLSKTMARPRIDSIRPGFSISEGVWGNNSWGTIHNPQLEPLESKNIDLSVEWYFTEGGIVSAALFYKDMSNFEENESIRAYWRDVRGEADLSAFPTDHYFLSRDPASESVCMPRRISIHDPGKYKNPDIVGCNEIALNARRNGSGATSQGVELSYTQNYDFLPGIWSGLGLALNYTYSDTETDEERGALGDKLEAMPLAWVPEHTANATAFWERNGHLLRLSYNYRTDSLANRASNGGALWNEGGGTLDLSATWKVNNNFAVTLSGVNLTDEISRQYFTNLSNGGAPREGNALDGGVTKSRTTQEYQTGRMYRLGLRATF